MTTARAIPSCLLMLTGVVQIGCGESRTEQDQRTWGMRAIVMARFEAVTFSGTIPTLSEVAARIEKIEIDPILYETTDHWNDPRAMDVVVVREKQPKHGYRVVGHGDGSVHQERLP